VHPLLLRGVSESGVAGGGCRKRGWGAWAPRLPASSIACPSNFWSVEALHIRLAYHSLSPPSRLQNASWRCGHDAGRRRSLPSVRGPPALPAARQHPALVPAQAAL
jgi:hypothetical protein